MNLKFYFFWLVSFTLSSVAVVTIGEEYGVSADGDGFFEIEMSTKVSKTDSLKVISIGYKDLKIPLTNTIESKLYLEREVVAMDARYNAN